MSKYISLVPKVFFDAHCEEALERLIKSKRTNYTAPFIYIVDDVFENNKAITQVLPVAYEDKSYYVPSQEPFTSVFIDDLTEKIILDSKEPSGHLTTRESISLFLPNPKKTLCEEED